MLSMFQKLTAFWKRMIGSRIDVDGAYGYQCVDYAKYYAQQIGEPVGWVGNAINGWKTGSFAKGTRWRRIEYVAGKGMQPNPGDMVFFAPTRSNAFGHVAIAYVGTNDTWVYVTEQNAGSGNGDGVGSNRVTVRKYPYKGAVVGNVLGWYTVQS